MGLQPDQNLSRRAFLRTAALAAAAAALPAASQTRPPNVILFVIDDLGWMDLGCQGSTFYETPHLDRLAREGVRFTDAYAACPVCSPSRAALMTGRYPGSVGFTGHITAIGRHRSKPHGRVIPPDDRMFLDPRETTLAEALAPAGYVSASIGKWHLGSREYWPERQGFDFNVAGYDHGSPPGYFDPYEDPDKSWNTDIPTLADREAGEYLTDRLTDEAVRFVEQSGDRPFLLYLPHYAVHTPLQAPPELVAKYRKKLASDDSQFDPVYAAMIEKVDDSLGRLMQALERLGKRENTLIVATSDNGGLLESTRNRPLREGKGSLYEGGVRVPLIVCWPNGFAGGAVSHEPVSGVDLYPTIAEAAGERARPGAVEGRSLLPALRDPAAAQPERDLLWYYPQYSPQFQRPGAALRRGRWKLIEHYDPPAVELYDLADDLGETRDLAASQPEKAAELLARLRGWIDEHVSIRHRLNPKYDPALAAQEKLQ
ncbi:MAG: sulfatase-like hydrolase/transferase [Acidobacteria bacterium]|nr:sulfatase-like hydrolase/transferase [Acidobacteriota bacterium]